MVHEEESEPDVVENEVHPVAEPDSLFHRFPNWGKKYNETSDMEGRGARQPRVRISAHF